jgi:hypothetical protein
LSSEDAGAYEELTAAVINTIEPTDAIEWLWTKDVIDHYLEISRLRRFKLKTIYSAPLL